MVHFGRVPTAPDQGRENGCPRSDKYNIEGVSFRRVFLIRRAAGLGAQAGLKCRHVINVLGRRVEIIQINILHVCVESGDFDGEAEIQQLVVSQ